MSSPAFRASFVLLQPQRPSVATEGVQEETFEVPHENAACPAGPSGGEHVILLKQVCRTFGRDVHQVCLRTFEGEAGIGDNPVPVRHNVGLGHHWDHRQVVARHRVGVDVSQTLGVPRRALLSLCEAEPAGARHATGGASPVATSTVRPHPEDAPRSSERAVVARSRTQHQNWSPSHSYSRVVRRILTVPSDPSHFSQTMLVVGPTRSISRPDMRSGNHVWPPPARATSLAEST